MTRLAGTNWPIWEDFPRLNSSMQDLSKICWLAICPVDVFHAAKWLEEGPPPWPVESTPTKPQRIHEGGLPLNLLQPIMDTVLACFAKPVVSISLMLSRMKPGQSHPYHVDPQRSDWITRVHVPLTTNNGAWLMFEREGERVHFEVGSAYSFNTLERHSFGNDGATDRVHLIFEVLRKD